MKKTKGFVLQVQQGVLRHKSHMQLAEEMQAGWLEVPRIGHFAFAISDFRGGTSWAEERMDMAIKAARAQWANGVSPEVEMIGPIFEPLEGELRFDERGRVEGLARVTFPDGNIYECHFKDGHIHGQGTAKFATGSSFTGQLENSKMHGLGTFTWPNGDVEVQIFEEDQPKGPGVRLEKASGLFWLLRDGKKVHQISETEAGSGGEVELVGFRVGARPKRW